MKYANSTNFLNKIGWNSIIFENFNKMGRKKKKIKAMEFAWTSLGLFNHSRIGGVFGVIPRVG